MQNTLLGEFLEALDQYTKDGRSSFQDNLMVPSHRQHQHPTVFTLPSLSARRFWSISDIGCVIDSEIVRAISSEYHRSHHLLWKDAVQNIELSGSSEASYLMRDGRWEYSHVQDLFPITISTLSNLNVFETSLGNVFFSRVPTSSGIFPHCEVTNCKLRVQIVLFDDNNKSLSNETESTTASNIKNADEHMPMESVDMDILEVDGETRQCEAGNVLVFDSSFRYSVEVCKTRMDRVMLFVDIWHPELLHKTNSEIRSGIEGLFPPLRPYDTSNSDYEPSIVAAAACLSTDITTATVIEFNNNYNRQTEVDTEAVAFSGRYLYQETSMGHFGEFIPSALVVAEDNSLSAVIDEANHIPVAVNLSDSIQNCTIASSFKSEQNNQFEKGHVARITRINADTVLATDVFVTPPEYEDSYSTHHLSGDYGKYWSLHGRSTGHPHLLLKIVVFGDVETSDQHMSFTDGLIQASEITSNFLKTPDIDESLNVRVGKISGVKESGRENSTLPAQQPDSGKQSTGKSLSKKYCIYRGFTSSNCSLSNQPETIKIALLNDTRLSFLSYLSDHQKLSSKLIGLFLLVDVNKQNAIADVQHWIQLSRGKTENDMDRLALTVVVVDNFNDNRSRNNVEDRQDGNSQLNYKTKAYTTCCDKHPYKGEEIFIAAQKLAEDEKIPLVDCRQDSLLAPWVYENALATMAYHVLIRKRPSSPTAQEVAPKLVLSETTTSAAQQCCCV